MVGVPCGAPVGLRLPAPSPHTVTDKLSIPLLLGAALLALWPISSLVSSNQEFDAFRRRTWELRELGLEEARLATTLLERSPSNEVVQETIAKMREIGQRLRDSESGGTRFAREIVAHQTVLDRIELRLTEHGLACDEFEGAAQELSDAIDGLAALKLANAKASELISATTHFFANALASGGVVDSAAAEGLVGRINWFGQSAEGKRLEAFDLAAKAVRGLESASRRREQTLDQIREELPAPRRTKMLAAHDELFQETLGRTRETKHIYLAVIAALLGMVAFSVVRMRRLAIDSRATKQDLEQRVRDRTEQLVKTNQDLRSQMSERRKAELETRAAQNQAEVASQAKSEFLANMSHEIRTPMTAILGFSERLLDTQLSERQRKDAVDTIHRNGAYLLQIINDILDLSKIEAGMLQVERITSPLVDVAKGVLELLVIRAEEKGLSLSVEYVGEVPEFIETDTVRLRQVLLNLVGNAIKFTRAGGVLIRIECVNERYEMIDRAGNEITGVKPFIKFSVIDTGIGMSEDQLGLLFSPFTQADSSTTRNFGGTGLGLSISKSLCGLLGGRIDVMSSLGHGSRFTFTVDPGHLLGVRFIEPTTKSAMPVPVLPQRVAEAKVSCRVLLAEDGIDNQRLIRYLLERAGSTVTIVGNGQQAVNHALSGWMDGDPYDVILMDMQMPVMDGYTAVRELRNSGYDRPIVALTAHAMATDREKCLATGCDAFCPKPIDKRELIGLIDQLTKGSKGTPYSPSPQTEMELGMSEFDDDPEMLELIHQFVSDLQADVVALRSAGERGDLEKISVLAHQLKGCAGGYGFPEIGEIAARVETLAKGTASKSELDRELEILCTSCQGLKPS